MTRVAIYKPCPLHPINNAKMNTVRKEKHKKYRDKLS